MQRVWLLALAACGSTSPSARPTSPTSSVPRTTVTADAMRAEAKTLCGDDFTKAPPRARETEEGCDLVKVGAWRGRMTLEPDGNGVAEVSIEFRGPADDVEAMRQRALAIVAPFFSDAEKTTVARAMSRLFQEGLGIGQQGYVGDLYVSAYTEMNPEAPSDRVVNLYVVAKERPSPFPLPSGEKPAKEPIAEQLTKDPFPSPAKPISEQWITDAKTLCTELVDAVSKAQKIKTSPPAWKHGEHYVECVHSDERTVGGFTVTFAPATRKLLYARMVGYLPAAKFPPLVDRLLSPLLSAPELDIVRIAAKQNPPDGETFHKAEHWTLGSRHEKSDMFPEAHEIQMSVSPYYENK